MKVAEAIAQGSGPGDSPLLLRLPLGLLGFEQIKQYVLATDREQAPFAWLQVEEDPKLAFLVINPGEVFPWYRPDVATEDVAFLGIERPGDALILNIVTLRADQAPTVNLKGPIVVNRHTLTGKQVIPANAAGLSVQHPLPVAG